MRRLIMLLLTGLLLTGCTAAATPEPAAEPTPEQITPPLECVDVIDDAVAGLQWGLDEKAPGQTITAIKAIPSTDGWAVVATVDGSDGIWFTFQDPTAEIVGEFAYESVDQTAEALSVYAMRGRSAELLDHAGIDLLECLAD